MMHGNLSDAQKQLQRNTERHGKHDYKRNTEIHGNMSEHMFSNTVKHGKPTLNTQHGNTREHLSRRKRNTGNTERIQNNENTARHGTQQAPAKYHTVRNE